MKILFIRQDLIIFFRVLSLLNKVVGGNRFSKTETSALPAIPCDRQTKQQNSITTDSFITCQVLLQCMCFSSDETVFVYLHISLVWLQTEILQLYSFRYEIVKNITKQSLPQAQKQLHELHVFEICHKVSANDCELQKPTMNF